MPSALTSMPLLPSFRFMKSPLRFAPDSTYEPRFA
jgi:hypothetical protein